MPYVQADLKSKIKDALQKLKDSKDKSSTAPVPNDESCDALATAYDDWAMLPLKAFSPVVQKSALKSALSAPMFAGWGPGFISYWTGSTVTVPATTSGLMGPTSATAGATIPADMAQIMLDFAKKGQEPSLDDVADKIAGVLFKATNQLIYILVPVPPSPTPTTLPLATGVPA
jgi:hypothetical protein